MHHDPAEPCPEELLPIVVGAHLRCEVGDRPLGLTLRLDILEHQARAELNGPEPIVCTDLWYLNDQVLMRRPTICIGPPDTNAATAYLGGRLPASFVLEDNLKILLDPDYIDLRACLWGVSSSATATALRIFGERYLDEFLRAAELARA